METNAQDLHKAPLNGWKHYFYEFLMLFLAVYCGFIAENIREAKVEREREKVYMENLFQDLKDDTTNFSVYVKSTYDFLCSVDTLMVLMKSPDRNEHLNKIYYLARMASARSTSFFFPNERTFDQMKSSGYLRLISNRQVGDSVSGYYNSLKRVIFQNEFISNRMSYYMGEAGNVFDASLFFKILKEKKEQDADKPKLMTDDPMMINKMLVQLQYYYGSCMIQNKICAQRLLTARNLIELVKKEYHFE